MAVGCPWRPCGRCRRGTVGSSGPRSWSVAEAFFVAGGRPNDAEESPITEPRINDRIRVPEVRLVGPNGEQVGIVRVEDALRLAQEADLDLVEVAPDARPPVCKLMDYGKYKYEADMKAREARRNQANTVLKEIRFRLKIDPHDYGTKRGHVQRFLKAGDKVKVMIMFRGREQSRPEMGLRLLQRLADDVAELGFVESAPRQDGRNMIMVIGPTKKKSDARHEPRRRPEPTTPASDDGAAAQAPATTVTAPAQAEPAVIEAIEPAAAEPAVTEPAAAELAVTEPAAAEPVTEPGPAEPVTEPAATEPVTEATVPEATPAEPAPPTRPPTRSPTRPTARPATTKPAEAATPAPKPAARAARPAPPARTPAPRATGGAAKAPRGRTQA